jgi:hypothetical protein
LAKLGKYAPRTLKLQLKKCVKDRRPALAVFSSDPEMRVPKTILPDLEQLKSAVLNHPWSGIIAGPLLRSINKAGRIWGHGFTPKFIWAIVKLTQKAV